MIKSIIVTLSLAAFALASSSAFACIPVTQLDLPLTINQSGSYCLSEDLQNSRRGTAITILADNVTLDLKGHILKGGIAGVVSRNDGVVIKNGTIANARTGVAVSGLGHDKAENNTIKDIYFSGLTSAGIAITHAKDAAILDNRIGLDLNNGDDRNSSYAIRVVRTDGLHIKNNTISMNGRYGNKPGKAFSSTQITNVIIENNVFLGYSSVSLNNPLIVFEFSNSRNMVIKNNNSSGIYTFARNRTLGPKVFIDNTIIGSSLNAFPTNISLIDGGGNQFF